MSTAGTCQAATPLAAPAFSTSGCTPDKKWPLVVCMHGRGGTAETFFDISCLHVVAEARNFIAVFPEAGLHQQKKGGLRNVLLFGNVVFFVQASLGGYFRTRSKRLWKDARRS